MPGSEASDELHAVEVIKSPLEMELEDCKATPAGGQDDVKVDRAPSDSIESAELIPGPGEGMLADAAAQSLWTKNDDEHQLARELAQVAADNASDPEMESLIAQVFKGWEERQCAKQGIQQSSEMAAQLHDTLTSFQTLVLRELDAMNSADMADPTAGAERLYAALLQAWEEVTHGADADPSVRKNEQAEAQGASNLYFSKTLRRSVEAFVLKGGMFFLAPSRRMARRTGNAPCEVMPGSEASDELHAVEVIKSPLEMELEDCKATPAGGQDDVKVDRAPSDSIESAQLIPGPGEGMLADAAAQSLWTKNDDGHQLARELAQVAADNASDPEMESLIAQVLKGWEERQCAKQGIQQSSEMAAQLHDTLTSFQTLVLRELDAMNSADMADPTAGAERLYAALLQAWEEVTHGADADRTMRKNEQGAQALSCRSHCIHQEQYSW